MIEYVIGVPEQLTEVVGAETNVKALSHTPKEYVVTPFAVDAK